MQTALMQRSVAARSTSLVAGKRTSPRLSRASLVCRADLNSTETPEWVPAQAAPVVEFLESKDFKLQDSELYQKHVKAYAENEWVQKSTGWKTIPELINGRAAMLGFVAAAGAEIFGAGPVVTQLGESPQPVLILLALIVASTIIPLYKGTRGDYLESLRDTYSVPQGVFTEQKERLHGRLAMLGLAGLIAVELFIGRALL